MNFVALVHCMSRKIAIGAHKSLLCLFVELLLEELELTVNAIASVEEANDPIDLCCSSWRRIEKARLVDGREYISRSWARAWEKFSLSLIRKSVRYSIWRKTTSSFRPSQVQVPQLHVGLYVSNSSIKVFNLVKYIPIGSWLCDSVAKDCFNWNILGAYSFEIFPWGLPILLL